jgi:type I restriction enzyme S subunit
MKKGWEVKRLGEVCKTGAGGTPLKAHKDYYENGTIPWLLSGEVSQGEIFKAKSFITETGLKNSSARIFPKNTILIAMYGATAGQVGILKFECSTNQAICGILPDENYIPKFLFYYFLSKKSDLISQAVGGAQPNISQIKIKNTFIPVNPLPEQNRIVAILDETFDVIARAKENVKKNLQNAREVFEAYLQSVFANRGDGWEERNLGDKNLFEIIDGDRGKNYPTKSDFFEEGFCLFMNTKNVRPDGLNFKTTIFINENKDKALGNGKLKRNDVVMTTRGTIGNLGIYSDDVEYDNIRINSGMLIFRPNLKVIIPEYLFEILRSGIIKTQIEKHVSGAAQPQLPIKTLVSFTFPLPNSVTEQHSIVAKLDALSIETKKLEAIYNRKLTDLEELKKSILQKAFNGEL